MKIKVFVSCALLAFQLCADNSAIVLDNASGVVFDLNGSDLEIGSLAGGGNSGGNVTLGDKTLTIGSDNSTTTYNGVISGNGSIVKTGTGTLTLSSTNTYSGGTTITGSGAINISGDLNLGSASAPINLNNGILIISGSFSTARDITLTNQGTIDTAEILACSGSLTGTGGVIKQGSGIFRLDGINNNYSGTTIVNSGIFRAGALNALSSYSGIELSSGTILDLNGYCNVIGNLSGSGSLNLGGETLTLGGNHLSAEFAGEINGDGGIIKRGRGVLTFSGSNYYNGTTNIYGGGLKAGSLNAFSPNSTIGLSKGTVLDLNGYSTVIGNLCGGGNVSLGDATLTVGGNQQAATFAGAIDGSGGITKIGAGCLKLSGLNAYSGMTVINEGTLAAGSINTFSPLSEVNLSNASDAILNLSGFNNTIANLSGGGILGGNVCLGSGTLTFGDSNITGYLGAISGSGGITKQGLGTVILYGSNNTYNGITTINNGAIQAGGVNVFAKGSEVVIASGALLELNDYSNTIGNLSGNGHLSLSEGTLTLGNSDSRSYSGSISGKGGIIKEGSGIFTLTGTNNTYSGTTTINGGVLRVGGEGAFSSSSSLLINPNGIFELNHYNTTVANLSGAGSVSLDAASLTLGNAGNSTFSGTFFGSGQVVKQGTGTLILSGINNTYSGATVINEGTILSNRANSFSPNSAVVLGNADGVALDLGSNDNTVLSISGGGEVLLGAGTLTLGDGTNTIYSGTISSINYAGGLRKIGTGTLSVAGFNNSYGGLTRIDNGSLQALTTNSFSPNSAVSISSGGYLDLNNYDNAIASLSGDAGSFVTLGSATLTTGGNNSSTTYAGVISGSGGIVKAGEGVLTLTGDSTYTGTTEVLGGGIIAITSDTNLGNTSQINLNNGTLAATGSDFTLTTNVNIINSGTISSDIDLTISGSLMGSGRFTKSGPGIVHLSSKGNTYSGPTIITGGSLQIEGESVFSPNSQVCFDSDSTGTLNFNGYDHRISVISGGGHVDLGSAALTIDNINDLTYEGVISGTGAIIKEGSGFLDLRGAHTYSGSTTINSGALAINGSVTSPVTVGAGARLQGNGIIAGNVMNYGTLAPGNSIGTTVIIGPYSQLPGSTLEIETTPTISDGLFVVGTVTIGSDTTLEVVPLAGNYPTTAVYEIINSTDPFTGTYTYVDYNVERASGSLVYSDFGLILLLNVLNYQQVAAGSNAFNVAGVLDSISEQGIASWTDPLNNLFYLNNRQLNEAYAQMVPAQLKGLAVVQQNNGVRVQDAISLRFQNVLDDCKNRKARTYLWADGIYSTLHQSSITEDSNPLIGYHSKTGGGAIGVDFNFLNAGYIGFMGAGTSSTIHWEEEQGNGHIYSGYVGVYGSFIGNGPFMNTSLLTGWNTYKAARNIVFIGADETAINEHSGMQFLAHLDLGWNFSFKQYKLRLFDSVDYILQHENRFQEENAGVFNLDVRSTAPQMVRNELGLNFAKCFKVSKRNTLLADIKLSWVLEERFNGENYVSNFDDVDNLVFTTEGYFPNRSLFSPGASLTANFCEDRAYITASYDAEIGNHYNDQVFSGQIGIKF